MTHLIESPALNDQIALYQRQAELWKTDHDEATALFNPETVISLGMAVFASLTRLTHLFNDLGRRQAAGFDREGAEEIRRLYAQWMRISDPLFQAAEAFRAEEYRVDKAGELADAMHDAHAVAVDFDRITSALEQFSRGRGRSLGEAMDEIRNRTVR